MHQRPSGDSSLIWLFLLNQFPYGSRVWYGKTSKNWDGEGEDHRVPEPDRADAPLSNTLLLIPPVPDSLDFFQHSPTKVSWDLHSSSLSSGKLSFLPLLLDNSRTLFKSQFVGAFSHSTSLLFSPSRQLECSRDQWGLSSHFKPWGRRENYGWQNYKIEGAWIPEIVIKLPISSEFPTSGFLLFF